MLVGEVPQTPLFCIFQCRLRVPAGHFLSDDTFRVIENLHKVRCSFCQRSILHLFRGRRIQKQNAPFLHTLRKFFLCQQRSFSAYLRGSVSVQNVGNMKSCLLYTSRAIAGTGRRNQLPCDLGEPFGVGKYDSSCKPPVLWSSRLFPQVLQRSASVYRSPHLRGGRLERPGFCGAAAFRWTYPVRRHEPPASGRPRLGEQAEKWAGKTDIPLRPLQQKMSGRADGTSGNPLRL